MDLSVSVQAAGVLEGWAVLLYRGCPRFGAWRHPKRGAEV